jgi:hypothetical protein
MIRRQFLWSAAWVAAGTTLGVSGCSSDATQGSPAGQEADNKQILDSAAANDKAGGGKNSRRKPRGR